MAIDERAQRMQEMYDEQVRWGASWEELEGVYRDGWRTVAEWVERREAKARYDGYALGHADGVAGVASDPEAG